MIRERTNSELKFFTTGTFSYHLIAAGEMYEGILVEIHAVGYLSDD